jgi:hypothetical protein
MLVWQLWHKAVAINAWQGRISPHIDQSCPICNSQEKEIVLHYFWSCEVVQRLSAHNNRILKLLTPLEGNLSWSLPDWSQCIFASSIPGCFSQVSHIWALIRSVTLWCIWIERKHTVFNQAYWPTNYTYNLIWEGVLKYAKAAWSDTLKRINHDPHSEDKALKKFDSLWGHFLQLCMCQGRTIT